MGSVSIENLEFVAEWDEEDCIDVAWVRSGRRRLNEVIRKFNACQRAAGVAGAYDIAQCKEVLVLVEEGRQTWAAHDGGGNWRDVLDEMAEIIRAIKLEDLDG